MIGPVGPWRSFAPFGEKENCEFAVELIYFLTSLIAG